MKFIGWRGEWNTTKTTTSEMAIVSNHGIMSIRVIASQNGKKVEVFTGYEPLFEEAVKDGELLQLSAFPIILDHRYVESIKKAANKWDGQWERLTATDTLDETLCNIPISFLEHVRAHLKDNPTAQDHVEMLCGFRAGVASAPKQSQKAAEARERLEEKKATRKSEFEQRAAQDELYGIF